MFECNLDSKQRVLRVVMGMVLMGSAWWAYSHSYGRFFQMVLGASGLFTIFEGLKGWCALKSLGIKIPF